MVEQIIEVGTSELLGKYKVHIGDKMYTTQDVELKDSIAANANVVCKVGKFLDVEVLGVEGNYFNVKYENYTGYVKGDNLVSYYTNPEYVEKCRLQKILNKLSYEINVRLDECAYPNNIKLSVENTSTDGGVEVIGNTFKGLISLNDIKNNKTITLKLTLIWENNEEFNESDTNLGTIEANKLKIPITITLNQYQE